MCAPNVVNLPSPIEKGASPAGAQRLFPFQVCYMSPYCSTSLLEEAGPKVKHVVALFCRTWRCPHCSKLRKSQLIAEAIGGQPNTLITLTYKVNDKTTPELAAVELAHAWRRVRRKLTNINPEQTIPFLAVFERTKQGWPHLHILARSRWIDQKWLSNQMDHEIGSPIVYIQRIDNAGRVSGYVAKYIGKDPHRFGNTKRYWSSRGYDLREPYVKRDTSAYVFRQTTLYAWALLQRTTGWFVQLVGEREAFAMRPP